MSVPAAFEAPAHHSLPFVARAYVLLYQIADSVTGAQICSRMVQEVSLDGMVIVLEKVLSKAPEYSMR